MKLTKKAGSTSEIWEVFIQTTAAFDGSGLTGLTNASGSLTAYYHRNTDTTATAIALVSMTVGTFTSSGFKEIDSANMPGWYQFCPPNAALASGAKSCSFLLKGATNMAALPIEVQLTAVDPDSATAFITGVNAVAPPTNWNLLSIDASGRVDLAKWIGSAPDALSSGKIPTDVKLWLTGTPNALQSGRVDSYLGAVAAGVIAAASFAANALDAVWSTTARTLSSGAIAAATFAANALDAVWATTTRRLSDGTNIVLAKGVGVTGFTDLSAAQVNTECDTALSDVGVTGTVTGRIDAAISSRLATGTVASDVTAIKAKTDGLPSDPADASDIASAFGTVNSTLSILAGYVDTEVAAIKAKTDNLPAAPAAVGDIPSAASIADAYLDRANGIETGLTPRQADRLMVAALVGKASGMGDNAPVFRDFGDTKDRITATTDSDGNRLTVTADAS
jgi:hypothetical protein